MKNQPPLKRKTQGSFTESEKRKMEIKAKKDMKNRTPATGKVDSYSDEVGQRLITGGRGFGNSHSHRFNISKSPSKGQAAPDAENIPNKRGKIIPNYKPIDKSFIRKPKK